MTLRCRDQAHPKPLPTARRIVPPKNSNGQRAEYRRLGARFVVTSSWHGAYPCSERRRDMAVRLMTAHSGGFPMMKGRNTGPSKRPSILGSLDLRTRPVDGPVVPSSRAHPHLSHQEPGPRAMRLRAIAAILTTPLSRSFSNTRG